MSWLKGGRVTPLKIRLVRGQSLPRRRRTARSFPARCSRQYRYRPWPHCIRPHFERVVNGGHGSDCSVDRLGRRFGYSRGHTGSHFLASHDGALPDFERALAFALLGGTIALGYFRHRDLLVGILLAIIFAALLEAGQNFVPGRHGHIHDLLIKALAVILGAAVVWILRRMQRCPQLPAQRP